MCKQQQNLGVKFGSGKMHLNPQVAKAAVLSKVVILLFLIYCCSVALPHGAMGLSAVCDCGIP